MTKTMVLISCLIIFAIQIAAAQDTIMVEPGKPCPMTGLRQDRSLPDQAHQQQDILKNRYTFPTTSNFNSSITIDAILKPGDDRNRFSQNEAAEITGYVMEVKPGGSELCNCKTSNAQYYDTHIGVALSPTDLDPTHWMIVEVTPRIRNYMHEKKGLNWFTDALRGDLLHRRITFQGWMLFDNDHVAEARNTHPSDPKQNNWRATCWEIHPVTSIESADDQALMASEIGKENSPEGATATFITQPQPPTNMNPTTSPQDMLYLVILAALLGMAGQTIRFVVGIRKSAAAGTKSLADIVVGKEMLIGLFISLTIGGIAGILASVSNMGLAQLDRSTVIAFISAGYAGTDLIEGFVLNK